jgi:hypothetical protein
VVADVDSEMEEEVVCTVCVVVCEGAVSAVAAEFLSFLHEAMDTVIKIMQKSAKIFFIAVFLRLFFYILTYFVDLRKRKQKIGCRMTTDFVILISYLHLS